MDNCTKLIFKNVNHTNTHHHVYSHASGMKIITGVGVGFCGLAIVAFTIWIIWERNKEEMSIEAQSSLDWVTSQIKCIHILFGLMLDNEPGKALGLMELLIHVQM